MNTFGVLLFTSVTVQYATCGKYNITLLLHPMGYLTCVNAMDLALSNACSQSSEEVGLLVDERDLRFSSGTSAWSDYAPSLKLTAYRLSFMSLTLGLGTWKAISSYKNQTATVNTLDCVIGTVLALS